MSGDRAETRAISHPIGAMFNHMHRTHNMMLMKTHNDYLQLGDEQRTARHYLVDAMQYNIDFKQ